MKIVCFISEVGAEMDLCVYSTVTTTAVHGKKPLTENIHCTAVLYSETCWCTELYSYSAQTGQLSSFADHPRCLVSQDNTGSLSP